MVHHHLRPELRDVRPLGPDLHRELVDRAVVLGALGVEVVACRLVLVDRLADLGVAAAIRPHRAPFFSLTRSGDAQPDAAGIDSGSGAAQSAARGHDTHAASGGYRRGANTQAPQRPPTLRGWALRPAISGSETSVQMSPKERWRRLPRL